MAKILGPPPITNLDGIIALVTDPKKYATYLQDLKALHDAIKESLGVMATKEQADKYLSEATTKLHGASTVMADVTATKQAMDKEMRVHRDTMAQQTHQFEQMMHDHDTTLTERKNALTVAEHTVEERTVAVAKRERDCAATEQRLLAMQKSLDEQAAKLQQAKSTLSALGV